MRKLKVGDKVTVKGGELSDTEYCTFAREMEKYKGTSHTVKEVHTTGNVVLLSGANGYWFSPEWLVLGISPKDKKEAMFRMLEGEKFTYNKALFLFSEEKQDFIMKYNSGMEEPINGLLWLKVTEWVVFVENPKWYENIPEKGIPCWVSDTYKVPDEDDTLTIVKFYKISTDHPYNGRWKYATPLTKEDLYNEGE